MSKRTFNNDRRWRKTPEENLFTTCLKLLIIVGLIATVQCGLSGHYYDNGQDQTTVVTTLDIHEKEVMQEEILHLLGLHTRPHR